MALYKYFKKETVLPNPNGVLSATIPSSSIRLANKLVKPLLEKQDDQSGTSRGQYESFTPEEKAKIAKCAIDVGVTRVLHFLLSKHALIGVVKMCMELIIIIINENCTWARALLPIS